MRHFKTILSVLVPVAMVACTDTPIAPDLPDGMAPLASISTADRITEADVLSFLHSFGTGDAALLFEAAGTALQVAAPADGQRGRIFPFFTRTPPQRMCTLDWSIAAIGVFLSRSSPNSSYREFVETNTTFELTLDGGLLETIRTPVVQVFATTAFRGFSVAEGALIAPGVLAVGPAHTLNTVIKLDGVTEFDFTVTFFVDGSGSATCTG